MKKLVSKALSIGANQLTREELKKVTGGIIESKRRAACLEDCFSPSECIDPVCPACPPGINICKHAS